MGRFRMILGMFEKSFTLKYFAIQKNSSHVQIEVF